MSTVTDRFDAPFGAATEEVADQVRRGTDMFFGFDFEGIEVLEAATEADPVCVLGHVLLGVFLRLEGDPSGAGRHVRAAITAAPDATDRERSLVGLFFGGDPADGGTQAPSKLVQLEVHLERWPRDFLALFLSARLDPPTHAGRADLYRRTMAAEATMGHDWVYQSHTGMMCQERGELDRAQQLTERAPAAGAWQRGCCPHDGPPLPRARRDRVRPPLPRRLDRRPRQTVDGLPAPSGLARRAVGVG